MCTCGYACAHVCVCVPHYTLLYYDSLQKLNERGKKLAEAEENAEKLRCTTAEFERDAREFAKKKQGKMHR